MWNWLDGFGQVSHSVKSCHMRSTGVLATWWGSSRWRKDSSEDMGLAGIMRWLPKLSCRSMNTMFPPWLSGCPPLLSHGWRPTQLLQSDSQRALLSGPRPFLVVLRPWRAFSFLALNFCGQNIPILAWSGGISPSSRLHPQLLLPSPKNYPLPVLTGLVLDWKDDVDSAAARFIFVLGTSLDSWTPCFCVSRSLTASLPFF